MRADARANWRSIIDAAAHHVATYGANISLTAVSEDAGVGIATLYRKFPTRSDLLRAVLAELSTRTDRIIERALAATDDPGDCWESFVHGIAGIRPEAMVSAFAATFVADGELPDDISALREHTFTSIQRVLDHAKVAGLVREDLTAAQFQMGIASITRPLPDVPAPNMFHHENWLVDVYLHGLRP